MGAAAALPLQQAGRISTDEMREVFNLGIGMIAVLPAGLRGRARAAARAAGVETWVIGEIRRGSAGAFAVRLPG